MCLVPLFSVIYRPSHCLLIHNLKQAITVGVIGSFTTLSTVSADTVLLVENGFIIQAFIYILFNIALGLVMAYLGVVYGKRKEVRGTNE